MTPVEFFEKAFAGSRIRYDKDNRMHVRIVFVSRVGEYAMGKEFGTNRNIYLFLKNGMLKEGIRGCFASVELFP